MRKRIIFILSFVAIAFGSYAQNETVETLNQVRSSSTQNSVSNGRKGKSIEIKTKTYKYEISVGPRAGVGFTMASESGDLKVTDGGSLGWDAGLAFNVRYGNKDYKGRALHGQGLFGVGLEVNYANRVVKTKGADNLSLNYIDVPLLFQFYPVYNTARLRNFFVEIGPTFSIMMSSSPKELVVDNATYHTSNFKGGDIKGTVGLGWRFDRNAANDGLYFSLRYNFGTSKLAGNFPCKVSTAELTIGYLFKCIGSKRETSRKIR